MLASRRMFRVVSVVAVVAMVATTAYDPPPAPSDHIEVTYLDIPEPQFASTGVLLNHRGDVVVSEYATSPGDNANDLVAYHWSDGQVTRIGERGTEVRAFSDSGYAVGSGRPSDSAPRRPFVWFGNQWETLDDGMALEVNDLGAVAGGISESGNATAAVWHDDELLIPPVDPPLRPIAALEINNRNQVLLLASDMANPGSAVLMLWELGGEVTRISEPGSRVLGYLTVLRRLLGASGVRLMNGRGMVLLPEEFPTFSDARTSLWYEGNAMDLGTLGGAMAYAMAINEWGQVVGVSTDADGNRLPFLWYQGEMTELGGLDDSGVTDFWPAAISNWGQVVGFGTAPDGMRHLFLWQNDRIVNLSGLVEGAEGWPAGSSDSPPLASDLDINDRGQVVAMVNGADDHRFPVMWELSPTWGYYPDGLP